MLVLMVEQLQHEDTLQEKRKSEKRGWFSFPKNEVLFGGNLTNQVCCPMLDLA